MSIGQAVSTNFQIGSPEIRIGALTDANKLKQDNSIGLLQSATVNFNQTSVDLEGGLPKTLIDTAITGNSVTINAQAYEYSRKNLRVMLNEGIETAGSVTEAAGTVTAGVAASGVGTSDFETDILLADISVGDLLVVYGDGKPENMSVVVVTAVAAGTVDVAKAKVTIDNTKTPLLFNAAVGDHVYKANQIGLGASSKTNYFSADVISVDHKSGKPTGFKFWKVAVGGGLDYSYSNDNFAVTPVTFKVLQPSAADYAAGGELEHLAGIIPAHPYGMQFSG